VQEHFPIFQEIQDCVSITLVLSHAVKRITTETPTGKMLWDVIGAKIAVYSPHTAHDNAETGINQQLAEMLELSQVEPLSLTSGRVGLLSQPVFIEVY